MRCKISNIAHININPFTANCRNLYIFRTEKRTQRPVNGKFTGQAGL